MTDMMHWLRAMDLAKRAQVSLVPRSRVREHKRHMKVLRARDKERKDIEKAHQSERES
jgi:hypothetical protein